MHEDPNPQPHTYRLSSSTTTASHLGTCARSCALETLRTVVDVLAAALGRTPSLALLTALLISADFSPSAFGTPWRAPGRARVLDVGRLKDTEAGAAAGVGFCAKSPPGSANVGVPRTLAGLFDPSSPTPTEDGVPALDEAAGDVADAFARDLGARVPVVRLVPRARPVVPLVLADEARDVDRDGPAPRVPVALRVVDSLGLPLRDPRSAPPTAELVRFLAPVFTVAAAAGSGGATVVGAKTLAEDAVSDNDELAAALATPIVDGVVLRLRGPVGSFWAGMEHESRNVHVFAVKVKLATSHTRANGRMQCASLQSWP